MDGGSNGDTSMIPKPKFDGTFNYGHGLTVLTLIIGGILYYGESTARNAELAAWQKLITDKVTAIETSRSANIPRLNNLEASDKIQDERMGNLADAVIEIRRSVSTIGDRLAEINTSVAVIKERTEDKGATN